MSTHAAQVSAGSGKPDVQSAKLRLSERAGARVRRLPVLAKRNEMKSERFLATIAVLGLACFVALSPLEDSAAYIVALICGALGVFGLSLTRDKRERATLIQLFCAAFLIRVLFALVAYKAGIVDVLGGGDDKGWLESWARAQGWQAGASDSLASVYSSDQLRFNSGFKYGAAYFFYGLNIRSQMALSFFNCFAGALTVVVVYRTCRDFFSRESSLVAAVFATILPGFLIWSALTVKESWIILFEITAFFAAERWSRERNPAYALLGGAMIFATLGVRFYVAIILFAGGLLALACFRARKPFRAAAWSVMGLVVMFALLSNLGALHLDVASIVDSQLTDAQKFRDAVSSGGANRGAGSGVKLDYDVTTPGGAVMMIVVGSVYLLLSPFPWQLGGRQIFALPDLLLWWGLLVFLIAPGIVYAWKNRPALLVSIVAFVLPLIFLYSMIFGNIGLAYRQRAQLMPFFLILAAAGSEARRKKNPDSDVVAQLRRHMSTRMSTHARRDAASTATASVSTATTASTGAAL